MTWKRDANFKLVWDSSESLDISVTKSEKLILGNRKISSHKKKYKKHKHIHPDAYAWSDLKRDKDNLFTSYYRD